MNLSNGKIWPYAIGLSIMLVFGFAVTTVIVTSTLPVEDSDTYMMYYQDADANANKLIEARIAFDKKYKIQYLSEGLSLDNSILKYKVTTLSGKAVNNAEILVVITRPNKHKYDQELTLSNGQDGMYIFEGVKLPVAGRWNLIAKVKVGDVQRFFNMKADTRAKEAYQY